MNSRLTVIRIAVAALLLSSLLTACGRELPQAPTSTSGLAARGAHPLDGPDEPDDEAVVRLMAGVDPQAFGSDYNATLDEATESGFASYVPPEGETPADLVARMVTDPRVIATAPNAWLETAESRQESFSFDDGIGTIDNYVEQPAMEAVGLDEAHRVSTGAGIIVAILDTGIDPTHPAFAGRILGGWDFVDGDADPTDVTDGADNDADGHIDEALGHGTHVAGIIARTAPQALLLIVRVLDADGRGDVLDVAAGVEWAAAHGARVINLSLGMLEDNDMVDNMLDDIEDENIVSVASAGNWGSSSPEEYPARDSHVIAVAASDADFVAAPFTSYGDFVDLTAPGVGVRSAFPGGEFRLWSGTSMAAPFVAGTTALLLARHPDWGRDAVLIRLAESARNLEPMNPALEEELGRGGLDAAAALRPDLTLGRGGMHLPPDQDLQPRLRRR